MRTRATTLLGALVLASATCVVTAPSASAADAVVTDPVLTVATGPSPFDYQDLTNFSYARQSVTDSDMVDVDLAAAAPPAPFLYNGQEWTSLSISPDGYVVVGGGDHVADQSGSPQSLPNAARPNNVIAPLWTDFDGSAACAVPADCGITYGFLGDGTNEWFVVQWNLNVKGTTDRENFQLWLRDTSVFTDVKIQDISFAYGVLDPVPLGTSLVVGAENVDGSIGDVRTSSLPTDDAVVNWSPGTVTLTAEGSQTVGGSPHFHASTHGLPSGLTTAGTLTCTALQGGTPISPALSSGGGPYTIDGSSCSGLSLTGLTAPEYQLMPYVGGRYRVSVPFVASPAPSISLTSSDNPAGSGDPVTITATLTPAPTCGSVSWLVDNGAPPTGTPTGGSGATYTLGPISSLATGVHSITALFSGCADVQGGGGTLNQTVDQPQPAPTSSVTSPTITGHTHSKVHKNAAGWYRKPVVVSFTCTPGSAPLAEQCPAAVTVSSSGIDQRVTRSVSGTDGGSATTTVTVNVDRTAPSMQVKPRAGRCVAADSLSGVASCVVHKHRSHKHGAVVVHWRATASDVAGNTTSKRGHYKG